ncbi:unnamed protein product, partial [Effrenium voratum]
MAWGKKAAAQKSAGKEEKARPDTKKVLACKEWSLPLKAMLRAYPDQAGCLLKVGAGSVRLALAPKALRAKLTAETSELANRPAMGLNLAAAAVEAGWDVAKSADLEKDLGLDAVRKHLGGQDFMDAARAVQKGASADKAQIAAAVDTFFDTLAGEDDGRDELGRGLAKLADGASRLLALALAAAEARALSSDLKHWAKQVPSLEKQAPKTKQWVNRSGDQGLLAEAMAQGLDSLFYWGGQKSQRRFGAASASQSKSKSPSASGASSSESKQKKVKKAVKESKRTKDKKRKSSSPAKKRDEDKKKGSQRKRRAASSLSPAKRGKHMEALAAWPEADAALVLAEAEAIKTEPLTGESFGKIKDLLKQVPEPVRVLRGLEAAKTAADAVQGEP